MKKVAGFLVVAVCAVAMVSGVVLAQSGGSNTTESSGSNNPPFPTLENPIKANSISQLVNDLVNIAFQIGSVIAVLAVIFVGFKFVLARGSEDKVKEAKNMFFWTVVGIAVLFGARVLAEVIQATVNNLKDF